jgi:uncharacterized protein YjiS (DUF1127 family)
MSSTIIPLRRSWIARTAESLAQSWATLQRRWRERREMQDLNELDEATLRDMGMPLWLQEEARARREQRQMDAGLGRLPDRSGQGRFY